MNLPQQVRIREVGPRDGLQNEQQFIETNDKIRFVRALVNAGIKEIELTSFVHPRAVPQLQDAETLFQQLRGEEVVFSALVGNARGVERALSVGVSELVYVVSASEAHNLRNLNMNVQRSLDQLKDIAELLRGTGVRLRGAVATAFGCPYQGRIDYSQIMVIVDGMLEAGIGEISLADTAGMADPRQITSMLTQMMDSYQGMDWGLHLHDTRGTGLANILAGLQSGIGLLESSTGGVGGCPFISGAAGNVATEDLVHMLHRMEVATGISINKLLEAVKLLEQILGRALPGKLLRAGTC